MDSGETECTLVLYQFRVVSEKKVKVPLHSDEGAVTGSRAETLTQQPSRGVCHSFKEKWAAAGTINI